MERQLSDTILQLRSELQDEQSQREKLQTEVEGLRERLSDARGDLAGQQKQLGASQEESKELLAKLTALEEQHGSLKAESQRIEHGLSDEVGDLRRQLAQACAQREGVQNELAALQKSHEQMQGQHQSSGESWQFALRSVRKEAQQMCEKSQQLQRQAEADLLELRSEQRGLADRYQKLELVNQELTAQSNDLKRRLVAAETLKRTASATGAPSSGTGDRSSSRLGHVFTKLGEQNKRSETKPPATAASTKKPRSKKKQAA
jgi:DNA repair exonuclease SbcCD ATPase subunit